MGSLESDVYVHRRRGVARIWSAPAARGASRAPAAAGTAAAATGSFFAAVALVAVSADGLCQLAFLVAIRARGSPPRTGAIRPVDPISLDALRLELCVARVAVEDTHRSSLMTFCMDVSRRSVVGAGDPGV